MKKIFLVMPLVATVVAGCGNEQQSAGGPPRQMGPVEVGVVALQGGPVLRNVELHGRVVARATAQVRPQVDGIIRKVAFQEAKEVSEGDVLYELDDRKFQAALAAAAAALSKAEAATDSAQMAFDRSKKLEATNAVSAQTLDNARSAFLQAKASQEAARADLDAAKINLDNATIRAPIGGMIGVSTVSVGSLVTANQADALATIRQVDPIYVDLVDSSVNLLRIRDEVEAGRLGLDQNTMPTVVLMLENGRKYAESGKIKLAEMVVSQSSGTFSLRATFPNPKRILLSGMFVRASVELGSVPKAFLVPQRAVQRNASGAATLFVVSQDGKAMEKTITTSGSVNNNWIVIDGVNDGDKLIVDGFQRISNGTAVKPVVAKIDDDGVVRQAISSAAQKAKEP